MVPLLDLGSPGVSCSLERSDNKHLADLLKSEKVSDCGEGDACLAGSETHIEE